MKRLVVWAQVIISLVSFTVPAFANPKDKHDEVIKDVLFGEQGGTFVGEKQKDLNNLLNAVAICLDQCNERDNNKLQELNDSGIHGLPESIDEIKFPGNQHHRQFTHKGWNYIYLLDKGKWETRKTILLQTVKEVFDFRPRIKLVGFLKFEKEYSDQCNAFAAFLYYLHILGEYVSSKENEDKKESSATIRDMIPLTRQHPGEDNEDVFWELERVLPIVCKTAVKDGDYSGLEVDIKILEQEARELGGVNDENLQQYRVIVTRLLGHLKSKVPGMLKKEPFFSKVFYPDMT